MEERILNLGIVDSNIRDYLPLAMPFSVAYKNRKLSLPENYIGQDSVHRAFAMLHESITGICSCLNNGFLRAFMERKHLNMRLMDTPEEVWWKFFQEIDLQLKAYLLQQMDIDYISEVVRLNKLPLSARLADYDASFECSCCIMCNRNEPDITFLPCKHTCFCKICIASFADVIATHRKCLECHCPIDAMALGLKFPSSAANKNKGMC